MRPDEVLHITGMAKTIGLSVAEESPERVVMEMPVTDALMQPFGYLHGGATASLLESAASWAAALHADYGKERAFGSHVDIHHIKSVRNGTVHGTAELAKNEDLGERGSKQTWKVTATDDAGDVVSCGIITTRTVSLEYLAKKQGKDAASSKS